MALTNCDIQADRKLVTRGDLENERSLDLNPGFPRPAARTPLATVRTALAEQRSFFSCIRTGLARGRTGLSFVRTGISVITVAAVISRIFESVFFRIAEAALILAGVLIILDGLKWYLPARKAGKTKLAYVGTVPTNGSTVLEVSDLGADPVFSRTPAVEGAEELRRNWGGLLPVMRRRFLASDRTDLAEERTILAFFRTLMARARTGLSFTRSGISFIGIGIGLLRQFSGGPWMLLGVGLTVIGGIMVMEGLIWYVPGRSAGAQGLKTIKQAEHGDNLWDFMFPAKSKSSGRVCAPVIKNFNSPGIWGTTGLALERTLLAERRNVMARLRTVMARSRTGLALIRTGMSISAVGLGLLVYFGAGNAWWTILYISLMITGLYFIIDGIRWHMPAEKMRKQLPYCYGEMEICIPEYGAPACSWSKAIFDHDN